MLSFINEGLQALQDRFVLLRFSTQVNVITLRNPHEVYLTIGYD